MRAEEFIVEETTTVKEKNLIGMIIGNKKITTDTPNQEWDGDFNCDRKYLTSLKGAPQSVGGGFFCNHNELETLQGAPQRVGWDFDCGNNQLTSLKGAPQLVGGNFFCNANNLTSLEGSPQIVKEGFYCTINKLETLRGISQTIGGNFYCYDNPIKTGLIHIFRSNIRGEIVTDIHPDVDELLNHVNKMNYNPNQKIAKFTAEIYKLAMKHNRPEWKDFVKP